MTPQKSDKSLIRAYNVSIKFLAARTRSIQEVKNNLNKKKFSDDIISEIILMLEEESLIDDNVFASEFVFTREKIRPKSKFALQYELKKKGISNSTIENVIKDINENKSALAAVKPKLLTWLKLDNQKMKNKMINFLKNRGFNWEISSATYEKVIRDIKNQEEN
ncbi:MAG: regulatory protein RecX [Desulfobacteraceae bacterium]|nr:regulatory protein RecX [Desulfobacteraceae bacterium]